MKTVTENREDLRVAAGLKVDDVNGACTAEEERAAWPNQRCFYDFGVRPQAVFSAGSVALESDFVKKLTENFLEG